MTDFAPVPIVLKTSEFIFDALVAGPKDAPLILLLHGFPQFADAWTSVLRTIATHGFQGVAVNQRGYSHGARPTLVSGYARENLVSDVMAFADALNVPRFHLVGHDWGGAVAWSVAAACPKRLRSLTVLSTPHPDAFAHALRTDSDQQRRSNYFKLFRAPNRAAEEALLVNNAKLLRNAYAGKVPTAEIDDNVRRFSQDGTLTAALNWYRAADFENNALGSITVPTTYIWGDQDQALGEAAALATAKHVTGPYHFECLNGKSHWLLEECPDDISKLLLSRTKCD